jgi:hypothetical protein
VSAQHQPIIETEDFVACESCGAEATHQEYDRGDPSVGVWGDYRDLCDDCGRN